MIDLLFVGHIKSRLSFCCCCCCVAFAAAAAARSRRNDPSATLLLLVAFDFHVTRWCSFYPAIETIVR